MHSRSPLPDRLYRPRPADYFEPGIVAKLNSTTNVVTYNSEVFNLRDSKDFGTLRRMSAAYLLSTTEQ